MSSNNIYQDIDILYNQLHDSFNEINELKKENTKLRIKLELQQDEITDQNKRFARAIAYNFSKNIEIIPKKVCLQKQENQL